MEPITLVQIVSSFAEALRRAAPEKLAEAGEAWRNQPLRFYGVDPGRLVSLVLSAIAPQAPAAPARNELLESTSPESTVEDAIQKTYAYAATAGSLTVVYQCARGHAYYPPPPWYEGKR